MLLLPYFIQFHCCRAEDEKIFSVNDNIFQFVIKLKPVNESSLLTYQI